MEGQTPAFAPAPADQALSTRITKLAEYYTRNGPAFEELLKTKQKDNPEYSFLFKGDGTEFYAWCLFCMARGLAIDKPLPADFVDKGPVAQQGAAPAAAAAAAPAPAPDMPTEVSAGFAQVLEMLNGTQESIKASSSWFLACSMHAAAMADMMVERLKALQDFPRQLHLIYLINDIFFVGPRAGQPIDGRLTAIFLPRLGAMMSAALTTSGCSPDAFAQMQQLLDLWGSRGIFDAAAVEQLRSPLLALCARASPAVAAPLLSPSVPLQHPPAPADAHAGYGAPPPAWHSQNQPVNAPPWPPGHTPAPAFSPALPRPGQPGFAWAGPPPAAHFAPAPFQQGAFPIAAVGDAPRQAPWGKHPPPDVLAHAPPSVKPYDILSFPAGIIPKLLRRHLRYEEVYTPLTADDIDREPPPPLPEKDAYMMARLDRFYAEIAEYRPGMTRAKYEETRKQGADTMDTRDALAERRGERDAQASHTGPINDGSYMGGPELERGGLGSHAAASGNIDDQYANYRRSRSGRYHEIMASKSTNPMRPKYGH